MMSERAKANLRQIETASDFGSVRSFPSVSMSETGGYSEIIDSQANQEAKKLLKQVFGTGLENV